jgi:hypothetical protein
MSDISSPSNSALPAEILLEVFQYLLPDQMYDSSKKKYLQNLRLTCKDFEPCATGLLFQHYDMVLWLKEDKTSNESRSLDLLSNNPRLAKLVRPVLISVASFKYDDIKRSIQGFARSTDEALRWLVRGFCDILGFDQPKLDFDHEDDQVGINIGDLTQEELLAMDEYCRVYLKEPTHDKEFGYPDLTHLQEEMGKRLTLFPNLQHTLLWRPTLSKHRFSRRW